MDELQNQMTNAVTTFCNVLKEISEKMDKYNEKPNERFEKMDKRNDKQDERFEIENQMWCFDHVRPNLPREKTISFGYTTDRSRTGDRNSRMQKSVQEEINKGAWTHQRQGATEGATERSLPQKKRVDEEQPKKKNIRTDPDLILDQVRNEIPSCSGQ